MWKIAIAFIAGVASAIALVAAFLWFEVQGFQDLIVVPESERVDASLIVRVPHPVDVMEFASMDSREILERFQFLGETDRAALKTLFDSNIRTKVEFEFKDEDKRRSQAFYIKNGQVGNVFYTSSYRTSVDVISKESVDPVRLFKIIGFDEPQPETLPPGSP